MQLKKIFVSLLVVIMILSTAVIGAMATEDAANNVFEYSVAVSATEAKDGSVFAVPGETVKVDITIANNPGAAFIQFTVKYDANVLKVVTNDNGVVYKSEDNKLVYTYDVVNARTPGEILFVSYLNPDYPSTKETGFLANLQFEVIANAEGDTTISVEKTMAYPSLIGKNDKTPFETAGDSVALNVHNYDVENPTVQYPCTGYRLYTCKDCGATVEVEPNPDGHNLETIAGTPATCTTDGTSDKVYCTNEGCTYVQADAEVIPAFGHTEAPVAAVAPTCSTKGATEGTICTVCNTYIQAPEEIALLPHAFGEWQVTSVATCSRDGLQTRYCANCVASETQQIPMLAHDSEVILAAEPATCTTSGLTEGRRCSKCSLIMVEQKIVPATGHTEVTIPAVEPTYTEDGATEGKQCSTCGAITNAPGSVPAKSLAWLWVLIGAVIVVGAGVAVYFFVLRKKK